MLDAFDIPEPTPATEMVMNADREVEEEKETEEHAEWQAQRAFAQRNIVYASFNDRWNRYTDVGYIRDIHDKCGLDVFWKFHILTLPVQCLQTIGIIGGTVTHTNTYLVVMDGLRTMYAQRSAYDPQASFAFELFRVFSNTASRRALSYNIDTYQRCG